MKILIVGGAGYVGSKLVPYLLEKGHEITVYDLYLFEKDIFSPYQDNPLLKEHVGDVRDLKKLETVLKNQEAVIHLACLSNDPSYELDPDFSKTINFDCFEPFVRLCKDNGIKRFIYASSSSVYGIKKEDRVVETLCLEPLTDYSKYKALCEEVLLKYDSKDFVTTSLRPATVCGYAPRQRLDVVVNILTNLAYHTGRIKIMGGEQKRPNIGIEDMVRAYERVLLADPKDVGGKIFNVGDENHTVKDLGKMIRGLIDRRVEIDTVPSDDLRSYHICCNKIKEELKFTCKSSIEKEVKNLIRAFDEKKILDPLNNKTYYNIRVIKEAGLACRF